MTNINKWQIDKPKKVFVISQNTIEMSLYNTTQQNPGKMDVKT